ncbi:MAG: hypothetical protein GY829_11035 [Gammaproteobacteria bacterium]|nr:hypothetical protein [Gammaproteobacteria bacterium]
MFENLQVDNAITEETDRLGGGVPDSGLYDCAIEMAYVEESSGGAMGFHLSLATANGQNIRNTFYLTGGKKKGQNNYYIDRAGNKQYLPGFSQGNSLAQLALGKNLAELTPEAKTILLYDFDAKKDIPQEKQVVTELIGQKIKVGVIKEIVNKNVKNADDVWVPIAETREQLIIDKFFEATTGCTVVERKAGVAQGEFINKWTAKNTGTVRNKTVPVEGGSTVATGQTQTESLFKN